MAPGEEEEWSLVAPLEQSVEGGGTGRNHPPSEGLGAWLPVSVLPGGQVRSGGTSISIT